MRISDWSSDVCSSDLLEGREITRQQVLFGRPAILDLQVADDRIGDVVHIGALLPRLPIEKARPAVDLEEHVPEVRVAMREALRNFERSLPLGAQPRHDPLAIAIGAHLRSEERRVGTESVSTGRTSWLPDH